MTRASLLRLLILLCALMGARAGLWCDRTATVVDMVRTLLT